MCSSSTIPVIHALDSTDTVMNAARDFYTRGELPVWGSVTAQTQTAGRGQYGRHWMSPRGNIFACIRLPFEAPFTDLRCGVAVSLIIASGLAKLGVRTAIKWPNDIVLREKSGWGKVAGILVEQKGELLLAGIGINVQEKPDLHAMREGAALPPARLCDAGITLSAAKIWQRLARDFTAEDPQALARDWKQRALPLLLWHSHRIAFTVGTIRHEGALAGLGDTGELLLQEADGVHAYTSGSAELLV